jgi:glyoxylase-like metal-dependent hydrolase (beta-lactamase superfamily II)
MRLYSVLSNAYGLDGGAMFGNAPRSMWEKWIFPDERNRLSLATRALVAVTRRSAVLFEAGIGAYLDPKLADRYGVTERDHRLLHSLAERGIAPEAVTQVILSHLHFDHAGGLLTAWQAGRPPELLFPRAQFYVSAAAWERATHPIERDQSSFAPPLNQLLEHSGRLTLLQPDDRLTLDELEIQFFHSEGHSPGMMCPDLHWHGGRLMFASDLIPGRFWVHLPITMGYDRYPELVVEEKRTLLASLAADDAWLYYVHDPDLAMSKVQFDAERNSYAAVAGQPACQLECGG